MSEHCRRRSTASSPGSVQNGSTAPSTPTNTSTSRPTDHATGFVDIYDSLTPRQISIITIGSAIGTGLMIGTGRALSMSGPVAIIISYTVVGLAVYLVLSALGEVAAWLPRPYTVADQAVRFCDPALGFSLGWIFWLKYAVLTPNQLTAAALVISYWLDAERINPSICITTFLLIITTLNFLAHWLPSRIELYVSSFKVVVMLALMIVSLVIAMGGGPDRERRGFRYWKHSGAFGNYDNSRVMVNFYMVWRTMSSATFAYMGSERFGILAQSPSVRKATSRAIRNIFYRILVFHILGITLIGMIVPHSSVSLTFYSRASRGAAASPFVAALCLAGISVLPDILNGCILLFVLSIANYDLYLATKAMCDLSLKHRAPAFLSRTNQKGVPVYALGVCSSLATLAYLNVSHDSTLVFGYFVDTVTMLGLLTWMSILITHISFVRARKAQGIPDKALAFKARFGLPGTWFGLVLCLFISLTMAFDAFSFQSGARHFNYKFFIASYIGIPLYVILIVGHKMTVKCRHVHPKDADLWTDKQESGSRETEFSLVTENN
ncbi:Amino acid/polyamine transporter I [Penicillium alfredii]|uniref:Amino acid/polyamine transporter I n=1 Tax=Penicillium alfredii TaxID=1506179 RepID=A0A9W9KG16_9EURO|nr:Amino acid/polyamine transporter I [Penicillium alfredii]KAJ5104446.1 Amino acid/polyamine transporter I [Penicillium alfredii]